MAADPLFEVAGLSVLVAGVGGLGAYLARGLAERGAVVTVADLPGAIEASHAAGLAVCPLDVTSAGSCDAAIEAARSPAGTLDVVINATGIYRTAPAVDLSERDWNDTVSVNLTGAFLLARSAGRAMMSQGKGRIITLASVSSQVVNPDYAAYAASKAGVAQLTRVLAREWAAHGITVNAIGPAVAETPMTRPKLDDPQWSASALARIPAGRFAKPDDILGAAIFLASPAGAFVTGQILYVDGGRTVA